MKIKLFILILLFLCTKTQGFELNISFIQYFSVRQETNETKITLIPAGLKIGAVYGIEMSTNLVDWQVKKAFIAYSSMDLTTVDYPVGNHKQAYFRIKKLNNR